MTGSRTRPAYYIVAGLLLGLLAVTLQGVQGGELEVPSEDQCRPYIEKALKDLGTDGSQEHTSAETTDDKEATDEESTAEADDNDEKVREKRDAPGEEEKESDNEVDQEQVETVEVTTDETVEGDGEVVEEAPDTTAESQEGEEKSKEAEGSSEKEGETEAEGESGEGKIQEVEAEHENEVSGQDDTKEASEEAPAADAASEESGEKKVEEASGEEKSKEEEKSAEEQKSAEEEANATVEAEEQPAESAEKTAEDDKTKEESKEEASGDSKQEESKEDDKKSVEEVVSKETATSVETTAASEGSKEAKSEEDAKSEESSKEKDAKSEEASKEKDAKSEEASKEKDDAQSGEAEESKEKKGEGDEDTSPEEEELIMEIEIPAILRPRDHIGQLLKLDEENEEREKAVEKTADVILRDLKRLYDSAIKPLETMYKYRDLSNRHFGDPEIFSKPLVLFMGPWSGGKSSIINYLLDIEYKPSSLRTGAEPSPAYFNILMHGEQEEVLDGTQLAADWTFSGLQKFGQGLLDRLKGYKLKNKLLEKVNIVEIPGILEIRKQVQRLFPFNDACQWFIDRADIIFLVYDPAKLDVGPETEAILDQLKGREYQTRIILNKADQVKPEELMRVQGALIWNISPLMSSAEPPIMYSASLWSIPFESGSPTRLLYAQERAFLRDLRSAIDKRVEHKIASARRFAVRVRNHAKMVDCYLTTYYNHKSFFAKRKDTSDRIVENPQDYHIYEGLSTLTNISRYDLPDPDVYRDFFRLNALYDFPLLSSTCTYFRGCPINRLDISIAYDLPELVGKYKKTVEALMHEDAPTQATPPPAAAPVPQKEAQKSTARSGASRISLS